MRDLAGRGHQRQRHNPLGDIRSEGRDARRPRLVPQGAVYACLHKPFLPAPHGRLGLAGPPHDLGGTVTHCCQKDDLRLPEVLMWAIAVSYDRFKPDLIGWVNLDDDAYAHRVRLSRPGCRRNPQTDSSGLMYQLPPHLSACTFRVNLAARARDWFSRGWLWHSIFYSPPAPVRSAWPR